MRGLTIGRVARQAGVGVETVRFYERRGLIDEPPRRQSGYRQFPEETVRRIRFIKRAQELGFSLREIKELLALLDVPVVLRRVDVPPADASSRRQHGNAAGSTRPGRDT